MENNIKLFKLTIKDASYDELGALVYTAPKAEDVKFLYLPGQIETFGDFVIRHKISKERIKIEEIARILTDKSKIILDTWDWV